MADRAKPPTIYLEFAFDRLLPIKLQQVYGLLVADCARPSRQVALKEQRGDAHENGATVIYARVSSDKQREEHTIASQTAALRVFAQEQGFSVPDEWVIEDEGYSGATLVRPGLERVRDLVAEGQVDAVLVHSPDRLSRKYAYQVLLLEEFARN